MEFYNKLIMAFFFSNIKDNIMLIPLTFYEKVKNKICYASLIIMCCDKLLLLFVASTKRKIETIKISSNC